MDEVYKIIKGFDNYEVSTLGNVRNIKTGRILKHKINANGYCHVKLSVQNKPTTKNIHRLVADEFLYNTENKKCVDHIDNNRLNNNLTNLRFATNKENCQNRSLSNNNTSGYKGITFCKILNKWQSYIHIDSIKINLGYFENKEDAINARVVKANKVFGIYTNECEKV